MAIYENNDLDPWRERLFKSIKFYLSDIDHLHPFLWNFIDLSKLIYESEKIEIKPSMIQPIKEIKALGNFKVKISLHSEVDAEITISVESAETIQ